MAAKFEEIRSSSFWGVGGTSFHYFFGKYWISSRSMSQRKLGMHNYIWRKICLQKLRKFGPVVFEKLAGQSFHYFLENIEYFQGQCQGRNKNWRCITTYSEDYPYKASATSAQWFGSIVSKTYALVIEFFKVNVNENLLSKSQQKFTMHNYL